MTTIKELFALSGNTCYYRGCEELLTNPAWKEVNAEIAHICGQSPKWARHDDAMTERERNDFPNLMLLCPKHHKLIDRLEPAQHPPGLLHRMKEQHIEHLMSTGGSGWASDASLDAFARLVLAGAIDQSSEPATDQGPRFPPDEISEPTFGQWLQKMRTESGMSQQSLSMRLMVSPSTISRWEAGNGRPNDSSRKMLCNVFDVDLGRLRKLLD